MSEFTGISRVIVIGLENARIETDTVQAVIVEPNGVAIETDFADSVLTIRGASQDTSTVSIENMGVTTVGGRIGQQVNIGQVRGNLDIDDLFNDPSPENEPGRVVIRVPSQGVRIEHKGA